MITDILCASTNGATSERRRRILEGAILTSASTRLGEITNEFPEIAAQYQMLDIHESSIIKSDRSTVCYQTHFPATYLVYWHPEDCTKSSATFYTASQRILQGEGDHLAISRLTQEDEHLLETICNFIKRKIAVHPSKYSPPSLRLIFIYSLA